MKPDLAPLSPDAGSVRIRIVRSRDLLEILAINKKSFVLPYGASVFQEFFREHRETFLVAELGDRVVGYSMSRLMRRISFRGLGVKRMGHIMSIAIHPEFRRKGIGRNLLAQTLENLSDHGAEEARLEVRVSNRLAIAMYESFGFEREKVLDGYYSDGEDAILMVKCLEDGR